MQKLIAAGLVIALLICAYGILGRSCAFVSPGGATLSIMNSSEFVTLKEIDGTPVLCKWIEFPIGVPNAIDCADGLKAAVAKIDYDTLRIFDQAWVRRCGYF